MNGGGTSSARSAPGKHHRQPRIPATAAQRASLDLHIAWERSLDAFAIKPQKPGHLALFQPHRGLKPTTHLDPATPQGGIRIGRSRLPYHDARFQPHNGTVEIESYRRSRRLPIHSPRGRPSRNLDNTRLAQENPAVDIRRGQNLPLVPGHGIQREGLQHPYPGRRGEALHQTAVVRDVEGVVVHTGKDAILPEQRSPIALDMKAIPPGGTQPPAAGLGADVDATKGDLAAVAHHLKSHPWRRPKLDILQDHRVVVPHVEAGTGTVPMRNPRHRKRNPPCFRFDILEGDVSFAGKYAHHSRRRQGFDPLDPIMTREKTVGARVPQHAEKRLFPVFLCRPSDWHLAHVRDKPHVQRTRRGLDGCHRTVDKRQGIEVDLHLANRNVARMAQPQKTHARPQQKRASAAIDKYAGNPVERKYVSPRNIHHANHLPGRKFHPHGGSGAPLRRDRQAPESRSVIRSAVGFYPEIQRP